MWLIEKHLSQSNSYVVKLHVHNLNCQPRLQVSCRHTATQTKFAVEVSRTKIDTYLENYIHQSRCCLTAESICSWKNVISTLETPLWQRWTEIGKIISLILHILKLNFEAPRSRHRRVGISFSFSKWELLLNIVHKAIIRSIFDNWTVPISFYDI